MIISISHHHKSKFYGNFLIINILWIQLVIAIDCSKNPSKGVLRPRDFRKRCFFLIIDVHPSTITQYAKLTWMVEM